MMPVRLCYAGAVVEPKAAGLWLALYHALNTAQSSDLFDAIELRLFVFGHTLIREERTPGVRIWRLTDWAEITLREVLDLSMRDVPAPMTREAILGAIALAGYDRTEATT